MTSELSDGGEIATGIAVLPSTNIPNIPPNMNMDLSMSHSQPMGMQHRLQPTQFINWIPSHLPLQMDANFDPNNMHHPNSVMAIPYPVPFQNQFYQSNPYPPNYAYQPFVTQLETRYISIPTVNTLPSIQMPTQNTPNDMHPRSDSQIPPGPSSVNIPLMPNGSNPMFDFQMDSIPYHHEYMQAQLPQDDTDSSVNQKQSKPKRSQTKKAPKLKSPPPKNIQKKNPRGKDDESIDKSSPHPQNELNSDLVDDLVIFSAAQSDAVTQPTHLQDQLAKYKVVQAPPSGEPSPAFYKAAAHIRGPKVCCALGCEQVITKRRLCARHQKQKERNGGKISLKPEMEVGPTPIKRKKEDENIGPSSVTSPPDMTASIKIDYSQPPAAEKSNGAKPKKAPRKGKMSPKKKAKQELDSSETGHMSHENGMENGRYTAMNNNNYMNNASLYDTNRTMLTQSGSLEDMFQSQEGTDVSEPQSDASNDQLCDNYFKEIL